MKYIPNSSVLKKYIVSYILVFLVPFIAFIFIVNNVYVGNVREELSSVNQSYLEQSNIILSEQLFEIRTLGNLMNNQKVFNRRSPYTKEEFVNYSEVIKQYQLTAPAVDDLYIIMNNGSHVFTSRGFASMDAMFSSNPLFSKIEEKDKLKDLIYSGDEGLSVFDDHLFYTMPLGTDKASIGTILVSMNKNVVTENIKMINRENETTVFLVDEEKKVLLLSELNLEISKNELENLIRNILNQSKVKIENNRYLIDKVTNDLTGWSFIAMTEQGYFYRPLYRVLFLSITSMILIMVIGITFSLYFAKKNYRPIQKLVQNFDVDEEDLENEWDFIQANIKKTYSEVENLTTMVDEQAPIIRNAVLLDLIKGNGQDKNKLNTKFKEYHISFPFKYYSFAIIQFDEERMGTNEILQVEQMSQEINNKLQSENYHFEVIKPYLSNHQIFLILNLRDDKDKTWHHLINKIQERLNSMLGPDPLKTKIGIGLTYKSINKIKMSYIEASAALEATEKNKDNLLFFKEIDSKIEGENRDNVLEYPEKELLLLIESLKQGNYEVAHETLDTIFGNLKKIKRNRIVDQTVISYLFNNVLQLTKELGLANYTQFIFRLNSFDEVQSAQDLLQEISKAICVEVEALQVQENRELGRKINNYITEYYTSSSISLEQIASNYNISIPYASKLIKEEMNENFSTIVQNLRMNKFKELLVTTSKPIKYLVDDIGYLDVSNFTRKFRQENGMTPSKYRKKYK